MWTLMQGDQYKIPFYLTDGKNRVLSDQYIKDIEICIGKVRHRYPEITYNEEQQVWEFPLSQKESFSFTRCYAPVQIRIQTYDDEVVGLNLGEMKIFNSISKELFEE